jgi:ubiquinone/menaquinone biosynthesis C-methylase UbiE
MNSPRTMAATVWHRSVNLGFRLLYNELAWLYDPVSWVVSLGRWRAWQRTILPHLPQSGRVLEVGFGPGHILAELAADTYEPFGLDQSPGMLRLARRRLHRQGLCVALCRGRAGAIPFARHAFDTVISTFPTAFVYDPSWIEQVVRVLRPGGRLVVVETASFTRDVPLAPCLERLYQITGQRGPVPDLCQLLRAAGLEAWQEQQDMSGTSVRLTLAAKRKPGQSDLDT